MTKRTVTPPDTDAERDSVTADGVEINVGDTVTVRGKHHTHGKVNDIDHETNQITVGMWVINLDRVEKYGMSIEINERA